MPFLRLLFVLLLSLAVDGAAPTLWAAEAEIDEMEEAAHRGWRGRAVRPGDAPAVPRTARAAVAADRRPAPVPVPPRRPDSPRTAVKQPPLADDSPATPEDHSPSPAIRLD